MWHNCEAGTVFDTTMLQELLYATTGEAGTELCHDCAAIGDFAKTTEQELLYATTVKQEPICATTARLEVFSPRFRHDDEAGPVVPRL